MTTERDLIQRLTDALTNAIRVIHNEDGTQHVSTATPVLTEAHAYLDQLEPKPPSLKESALNALEHILRHSQTDHGANTIRRALEALPDD